jgi:DNA-binding PadR family transcriptional regulator
MSLDHALLVSLLEKPSSGYELARRFDKSIGHFWHATHQQIYRVLSRMEEAGWIASEIQRGASAPDRRVFTLTGAGRQEVSKWLAEPSPSDSIRSTLMIKFRAAAFDDPRRLIPEIRMHLDQHEQALADYRQIEKRDFLGVLTRQQALQYQVLKLGIVSVQNWITWCNEALVLIDQLCADPSNESLPSIKE